MRKIVLFFTTVDWYFASHRLHLAETLIDKEYDVFLVSNFTESRQLIEKKGIKTIQLYTPQSTIDINDVSNVFRFIKYLSKFQPNIVHSIALKAMLITGFVSRFFPKITFIHAISGFGSSFSVKGLKKNLTVKLKFSVIKIILKSSNNIVIVQNESDYKRMIKYIDPNRLYLIKGSGVDTNQFLPNSQGIEISKLQKIKVLLPCRLIWEKGIQFYAEAAAILTKRYSDKFEFYIAGRLYPANKYSLKREDIEYLQTNYPVKWLGNLEKMQTQYPNYQIVCLPSFYNEGLPRVLIEACACGVPCVTTNHPGCNDIIINDFNGKTVPIKDAEAIANAIEEIVRDDDFYQQLSRNARQRVVEKFSSELINQETINLYNL